MKHLAAYLLLGLGGNASPSAEDIKTVLSSVGIEADADRLTKLISELEGKDISEPPIFLEGRDQSRKGRKGRKDTNNLCSSSLPVPRSSLPFPQAVLVALLPLVVLPPVLLPLTLLLRRRRRRRRSLMRTWASVSSTKRVVVFSLTSAKSLHGDSLTNYIVAGSGKSLLGQLLCGDAPQWLGVFGKVSLGETGYLVEEIMDGSRSRTGKIEPRLHESMAFTSRSWALCRT
ncbi:hypothetical protein E4U32_007641 [Claviceps aff. humidiphila group G2b]|nr:hypothetical protein E4U32_007641 [Claviceps aff. humidiphila group G2b]